jgi:hypothetical protein
VPDISFNNSYNWSFNGSTVGGNSRTYAIPSLTRETMGTYTCVVTNSNITGSYTYTFQVNATATIEGILYDENDIPATAGYVELFRIGAPGTAYENVGLSTVDATGAYKFEDVLLADYLLKGVVSSSNPFIIPTWHEQSIYWEEATTLLLTDNTQGINIYAEVRPIPPQPGDGPGSISGTFYEILPDEGCTG